MPESRPPSEPARLAEVAAVFLKLGTIGFGGPAAHVAMIRQEVVVRRGWVGEQEFLDALGATSVMPGPGSTQMAIYLSRRRAGWLGLVVGGACFILPATAIVLALAWAYVRYGTTDVGRGLLYGITPVVIGIVADAVVNLGRVALKRVRLAVLAAVVVAGYFLGINVLLLLVGAGLLEMVVHNADWFRREGPPGSAAVAMITASTAASTAAHTRVHGVSLWDVFTEFLKLGVVVFGSGYVLFAFLQHDLVDQLHWLSARQLVDAVSVGQITPGPVFTTATFVGYLVGGFWGGVVATLGIFLPSFLIVAAFGWLVPVLRRSPWTGALLDGVNAAAVGLMAGVTWDLGTTAVVDVLTAVLAVASFLVMWRWRPNFLWLILGGAVVGVVHVLV